MKSSVLFVCPVAGVGRANGIMPPDVFFVPLLIPHFSTRVHKFECRRNCFLSILAREKAPPHFSRRVQKFECRRNCFLNILAREKDVQGMNMILLDRYCAVTYTKWCSSFLCCYIYCWALEDRRMNGTSLS